MASDFVVWTHAWVENAAVLDGFRGVPDPWELKNGIPRAEGFPDEVVFTMDPERPHDTMLVDSLHNTDRLIVASKRLKEFLAARALDQMEYLPVTILDHKGRPAAGGDYWIIHPLEPIDCLKVDECGARLSPINKNKIQFLSRLVIGEAKIDANRDLFRPKGYTKAFIVRRELASAIDEAGFTGIRWVELDDYRS
jgi:hypothetical protein